MNVKFFHCVAKPLIFKSRHKNWKRINSTASWLVCWGQNLDTKSKMPTRKGVKETSLSNESIYIESGQNLILFHKQKKRRKKENINTKINSKVISSWIDIIDPNAHIYGWFSALMLLHRIFNRGVANGIIKKKLTTTPKKTPLKTQNQHTKKQSMVFHSYLLLLARRIQHNHSN